MTRRDTIRQLFRSADSSANGSPADPRIRVKRALIALIIIVIIEAVFSYYRYDKRSREKEALAFLIHEERSSFREMLARQKIAQAYSDSLPIKITRNINNDDSVKVSGYIRNTGNREVGTITLTVFCLDQESFPVWEQTVTVESSVNKPLSKYQRHRFNITIDDPPENATGVQVFVSDRKFSG